MKFSLTNVDDMLSIGNQHLTSRLVLAPLAGYSDLPFRLLCKNFGAGLCVSEMISSHGLVYKQPKTLVMLQSCDEERPVSFQLFGADPAVMGEAAAIVAAHKADVIDINMGCPVKKVTKRGAGAALMADINVAETIIKEVVSNSSCPVTVKIRSGVDSKNVCGKEFAVMAETNGVSAVSIHGRTWKQGFSGRADWDIVKYIKESVSIPVLGNGDITRYDEAVRRLHESGCDGVLIGRGAIGNPWVFAESGRSDNLNSIIEVVTQHLHLIAKFYQDPDRGLGSIKNHLGRYFKGYPGCSNLRKEIYEKRDFGSLRSFIQSLCLRSQS